MSVLRISTFGGMVPRLGKRNLPDMAAQDAHNAKLFSGELRAWNGLLTLSPIEHENPATVYHFEYLGGDYFISFAEHTHVVQSPLLNDSLQRLYWSDSTGVWQNTKERVINGDPPYRVGVPQPSIDPVALIPTGGTAEFAETRVYVLTFVSGFGEEGSPSGPKTVTVNTDGTLTITGLNSVPAPPVEYDNITKLRLYRTITTTSGVDYRFVAEWDIGSAPASWVDTVSNDTLSTNPLLESYSWEPPPEGLTGLTSVGGYLVGFVGRRVYASVPYRPWAWPTEYQTAVEDPIVALGAYGSTVVVATTGNPYVIVGATPDAVSLNKIKAVLPCLSAMSLVSTVQNVIFASENGLVSVSDAGVSVVSSPYVTRDEWMRDYSPSTIKAAVFQDRYLAFYNASQGFMLGFDDVATAFTRISGSHVSSVDTSALTGQAMIGSQGKVYAFDDDRYARAAYVWRSKPFMSPKPENFGILQVRGDFSLDLRQVQTSTVGNSSQFGGALFGAVPYAANGGDIVVGSEVIVTVPQTVGVKIYADGVLRWTGAVSSERPVRLPSGYKAVHWEVEISGSAPVYSVTLASTGKALEQAP